jgi:hypothetical protein
MLQQSKGAKNFCGSCLSYVHIFYLYVENQSVSDFEGSIEGFRQTKTKLICYKHNKTHKNNGIVERVAETLRLASG